MLQTIHAVTGRSDAHGHGRNGMKGRRTGRAFAASLLICVATWSKATALLETEPTDRADGWDGTEIEHPAWAQDPCKWPCVPPIAQTKSLALSLCRLTPSLADLAKSDFSSWHGWLMCFADALFGNLQMRLHVLLHS